MNLRSVGRPSPLPFLGVIVFDRRFLCQLNSERERERERAGPEERCFCARVGGCGGGRADADAPNTERAAAAAAADAAAADTHLCHRVHSPRSRSRRLRSLSLGRSHFHGRRR